MGRESEEKDDIYDQMQIVSNKFVRGLLIIAGTFFVFIGTIGIFLPILPTTPFLLLAAACYARSSKRFYTWLLNNKLFGKFIRNYREGKGVPLKVKILTIFFLINSDKNSINPFSMKFWEFTNIYADNHNMMKLFLFNSLVMCSFF